MGQMVNGGRAAGPTFMGPLFSAPSMSRSPNGAGGNVPRTVARLIYLLLPRREGRRVFHAQMNCRRYRIVAGAFFCGKGDQRSETFPVHRLFCAGLSVPWFRHLTDDRELSSAAGTSESGTCVRRAADTERSRESVRRSPFSGFTLNTFRSERGSPLWNERGTSCFVTPRIPSSPTFWTPVESFGSVY